MRPAQLSGRPGRKHRTVPARERGLRLYNVDQVRLLAERRFIPIEAFAYWLKHGPLRDDLARHAPSVAV